MNNSMEITILMSVSMIIYTYLVMEFVDRILNEPKINKPKRLVVGCLNAVIFWMELDVKASYIPYIYIALLFVLSLEFFCFYKDHIKRVYLVASTFIFHYMTLHSIVLAVSAWVRRITFSEIIESSTYFLDIFTILLILLVAVLLLALKFIPMEKVQVICQHKEQLFFMNLWLTVFNFYLVMNARVYAKPLSDLVILENQIFMPIAVTIGLYVILYFSFNMSTLLGYQSENQKLMQGYYKEQQYREAVISEALISYESNLTHEKLVKGFEQFKDQYGDKIYDYKFMQSEIIRRLVYKDDVEIVYENTDSKNLLKMFEDGNSQITVDYRRLNKEGEYGWVRSVMHLYQDRITKDVMGFTYVKDINEEKQHQLELQERAERDSLTGLYNKGTVEIKIKSYLDADVKCKNAGALFLIDVDNFKNINDHLGHSKGDEVLRELTSKLKQIFRSDDILGRVGGDEFLVYIKRHSNSDIIEKKAKMICHEFNRKYTSAFGVTYAVSASVGIAIYPGHGAGFAELYKMADIALYNAKNKGKNIYSIYQGESFSGYESSRTKIDAENEKAKKHFIDNRSGYVFEILYKSETIEDGINNVLELLTKHYNYSRGYIFETSEDGKTTCNTFEWCNKGVSPEIDSLQEVPIEAASTSTRAFLRDGKFIMKSLDSLPELDRSVLEPQGIKSMLQFPMFESKQLKGFVGFDDCTAERHPDDQEIEELGTVCNIISTFLIKYRMENRLKKMEK
ncbi:MAG: sensor domain-containing diguanylate cyclase [Lachnospiraceae bacterium]